MQPTRAMRPRRHKWLTMSVFLVAYSIFQAVNSSVNPSVGKESTLPDKPKPEETPPQQPHSSFREREHNREAHQEEEVKKETLENGVKEKIEEKVEEKKEPEGEVAEDNSEDATPGSKKGMKEIQEEGEKKKQKDAEYKDNELMKEVRIEEEKEEEEIIPTIHPLRGNCTPPAIEQFPRPLMSLDARKNGGLIIHVLVAIFTFIGLAIVCDEYFVSSLDRICEELKLAPDVAGATFMAAGSSAPELATVIIGVFCAQDDIGVSGVIGSAVFNIMFVISVCALCAGTVSHLNWWPLCRDCFFYAISILVMLCTISNGYVSWPEALFMLIMYGVYCVALRFNEQLEKLALRIPLPFKLPTREEQAALVTYRSAPAPQPAPPPAETQYTEVEGQTKPVYNPEGAYDNAAYNADPNRQWDPNQAWDPNTVWGETSQAPVAAEPIGWKGDTWGQSEPAQPPQQPHSSQESQQPEQQIKQNPMQAAYYKAKEYNPETAVDPLIKPIGANKLQMIWWYIVFPIHWLCRHTMPDCRGRLYPISFFISMLWISFYSYFMVWMITVIGYTLGIPDTVMGLTFVAAGVSVPDALSSLSVIKEGYGDMAVSNAVGSNVFDILVCLGLPWFMQTAIIHPGSHVNVISKGLIYSTLSLFSTVVFLVVATHANGWKLDRKYGVVLMIWYLLFITFASLYELNIFGEYHQPDCVSSF